MHIAQLYKNDGMSIRDEWDSLVRSIATNIYFFHFQLSRLTSGMQELQLARQSLMSEKDVGKSQFWARINKPILDCVTLHQHFVVHFTEKKTHRKCFKCEWGYAANFRLYYNTPYFLVFFIEKKKHEKNIQCGWGLCYTVSKTFIYRNYNKNFNKRTVFTRVK